jgi:hypothetical protein
MGASRAPVPIEQDGGTTRHECCRAVFKGIIKLNVAFKIFNVATLNHHIAYYDFLAEILRCNLLGSLPTI